MDVGGMSVLGPEFAWKREPSNLEYATKSQDMQNMCKHRNMQNMLNMQNMQNNKYKKCNKYANKYDEYVNKYVNKIQNMQKHSPICRRCSEQK